MVGESSRFFNSGYKIPKYQLPFKKNNVFFEVISSFRDYFKDEEFLFIYREQFNTKDFLLSNIEKLGIVKYKLIELDAVTRGQAETVHLGLMGFDEKTELFIFNIDTIRKGYKKPRLILMKENNSSGYLEVFKAKGSHWSFIQKGPDDTVLMTAEKKRISNLCCTGLYHFKSKELFDTAFNQAILQNDKVKGEFFVAPLYNHLIKMGLKICFSEIDPSEIIMCGTPAEYEKARNDLEN